MYNAGHDGLLATKHPTWFQELIRYLDNLAVDMDALVDRKVIFRNCITIEPIILATVLIKLHLTDFVSHAAPKHRVTFLETLVWKFEVVLPVLWPLNLWLNKLLIRCCIYRRW